MLYALLTFAAEAAEKHEGDKTAFYVLGGLLAVYAVALSAVGITQHDFPRSRSAARRVMAVSAVFVLAAMASAVLTS